PHITIDSGRTKFQSSSGRIADLRHHQLALRSPLLRLPRIPSSSTSSPPPVLFLFTSTSRRVFSEFGAASTSSPPPVLFLFTSTSRRVFSEIAASPPTSPRRCSDPAFVLSSSDQQLRTAEFALPRRTALIPPSCLQLGQFKDE
ncbi:unnamed protein product, partial [Linum tenue]